MRRQIRSSHPRRDDPGHHRRQTGRQPKHQDSEYLIDCPCLLSRISRMHAFCVLNHVPNHPLWPARPKTTLSPRLSSYRFLDTKDATWPAALSPFSKSRAARWNSLQALAENRESPLSGVRRDVAHRIPLASDQPGFTVGASPGVSPSPPWSSTRSVMLTNPTGKKSGARASEANRDYTSRGRRTEV